MHFCSLKKNHQNERLTFSSAQHVTNSIAPGSEWLSAGLLLVATWLVASWLAAHWLVERYPFWVPAVLFGVLLALIGGPQVLLALIGGPQVLLALIGGLQVLLVLIGGPQALLACLEQAWSNWGPAVSSGGLLALISWLLGLCSYVLACCTTLLIFAILWCR